MKKHIIVRQEIKADFSEVYKVNKMAFGRDEEARLVDALRKNSKIFLPELSMVAIYDNEVVGHILFTRIYIKSDDGNLNESLALAPMAIKPEWQKQGIGGQLIRKGFEIAKSLGFKSVIVLGHERYYPKFGFKSARRWNIRAPFLVAPNLFMAIELVRNGLKNVSGTVIYPMEFEMV